MLYSQVFAFCRQKQSVCPWPNGGLLLFEFFFHTVQYFQGLKKTAELLLIERKKLELIFNVFSKFNKFSEVSTQTEGNI